MQYLSALARGRRRGMMQRAMCVRAAADVAHHDFASASHVQANIAFLGDDVRRGDRAAHAR